MACCGETGIDRRLHPRKTIPDGIVRLNLMHEVYGFFFKDPDVFVDSFVHMGDEKMGEIFNR